MKLNHIFLTAALCLCLCPIAAHADSPSGPGYRLIAPSTVAVADAQLNWTDDSSVGVSGYKVDVLAANKWVPLLRGNNPAQRSFDIPKKFDGFQFRVYAYTASRGNGEPTVSAANPADAPRPALPGLARPQVLGNPFTGKRAIYARNVWDMQSFGGKIYLGHGDSAANSGATPIYSLNPSSGSFTREYNTSSEQVDEFFPIGDALYTLDHDPTGMQRGKLYRTTGGAWSVAGAVDDSAHFYSMAQRDGKLWLAGSTWSATDPISAWSGSGTAWQSALTGFLRLTFGGQTISLAGNRTWMLLPVKGQLYAVQEWMPQNDATNTGFWRLNDRSGQFERSGISGAQLAAGVGNSHTVRYKRQVSLDDGSALTLLVQTVNDHQWVPLSLMWVRDIQARQVSALALPGGALPYDIIRRDNAVYVCAWDATKKQVVVFALSASNPAAAATEVLRFAAPTYARSFEEAGGAFYFGLGCDVGGEINPVGEIWKVVAQ